MCSYSSNLCSCNFTSVQLLFAAVRPAGRRYRSITARPAGGANSAPQTSWLDFGERKGMGKGNGKERARRKEREKKAVKGKRRGEKEKGTRGRGKGRILCSCDFSPGKKLKKPCSARISRVDVMVESLSVRRSVCPPVSPFVPSFARRCCGFAAVRPVGRRYRSIAARPAVSSSGAAAANAGSAALLADVGS